MRQLSPAVALTAGLSCLWLGPEALDWCRIGNVRPEGGLKATFRQLAPRPPRGVTGGLRRLCEGPSGPAVRWRPGVTSSYQEPPRTSPGGDPRRVPERGAGALPAPPADLVVHPRGLLAVRMSLDVGVKPEPAPQWLPSHEPTLGVAASAGKGLTDRRGRPSPLTLGVCLAPLLWNPWRVEVGRTRPTVPKWPLEDTRFPSPERRPRGNVSVSRGPSPGTAWRHDGSCAHRATAAIDR